jgi:hypothetical protein
MGFTVPNKVLQDLTDSVIFMSNKFDECSIQIQDLLALIKEIKV